jgi:hypothetical protein
LNLQNFEGVENITKVLKIIESVIET